MKFQHVSVIFVLIFIPIILVSSYFISLQVETIRMESDYSEKLQKATYDAMRAFELNTANEDLSAVSDSLRSIIEASNNIFFNTLCTNLGVSNASKSYIQPYIPAILYTLYDGYYIYSPTNLPEICVDKYGRTIRTSDFGVTLKTVRSTSVGNIGFYEFDNNSLKYQDNSPELDEAETIANGAGTVDYNTLKSSGIEQEYSQILYKNNDGTYSTELHTASNRDFSTYYSRSYILKSYIPYSARYIGATGAGPSGNQSYNITINYTLDNFITVEGNIGNVYYTKSGYLIRNNLVSSIEYSGTGVPTTTTTDWTNISKDVIDAYADDPAHYEVKVTLQDGIVISNRDGQVAIASPTGGSETIYWDDAGSAVKYYIDSFIFSSWFYENLSNIRASNYQNDQYSVTDIKNAIDSRLEQSLVNSESDLYKEMLYDFTADSTQPFSVDPSNDPENQESDFYTHKRAVIKNSITYNLILSMLVYTEDSRTVEFRMPVLSEEEWDIILNNVTIVSFMEGFKCGLKYFNNYAIVTSTNNEITVTDNEIYYVERVVENVDLDGDGTANEQILATLDDDYIFETAHRIDCENLHLGDANNFQGSNWLGCISFKSKEIKYDKILNNDGSYTYDHKAFTDYNCIVDSNYTVRNRNGTVVDGNTQVLQYLLNNRSTPSGALNLSDDYDVRLKAYRIAIAKERNNLYKTTAFTENYGWQTFNASYEIRQGTRFPFDHISRSNLNEILKIEVTIEDAQTTAPGVYSDSVVARYDTGKQYNSTQTISTTSKSRRTLEYKQDFSETTGVGGITLIPGDSDTEFKVIGVKVYYK